MAIYKQVEDTAGDQESRFKEGCDLVEAYFAKFVIGTGMDISTPALIKTATDSVELILAEIDARDIQSFLERLQSKPVILTKFKDRTKLTVQNGKLMTVTRALANP